MLTDRERRLVSVIRTLLNCCELNLDEVEEETQRAIDDANALLDEIEAEGKTP